MPEDPVSQREHLTRIMDERDRRYEERFKAQEIAVQAALAAQKELTGGAFAASREAISKAELAQNQYNTFHNDLVRKMAEDRKELMNRAEHDRQFGELAKRVSTLEQSDSAGGGKESAREAGTRESNWKVGIFIAIAMSLLSAAIGIIGIISRSK